MINVSEILNDPDLTQSFIVHRKSGTWIDGRFVQTETDLTFWGVVENANPKEMFQVPEGDKISGMVKFYSTSEMFTTREEGTSDEIEFRGDRYRVLTVNDWSNFGYFCAIGVYMEGV